MRVPWCVSVLDLNVNNKLVVKIFATKLRYCYTYFFRYSDGDREVIFLNTCVYESKYVINCGGAFSAQVYELVGGTNLRQTNFCGQHYVIDKDQGTLINSVVFPCPDEHGFQGILVAPTVHGNLILGPDAYEAPNGDCIGTVEPYLSEVKKGGLRSVPSIDFRKTIQKYAGVRPNTQVPVFVIEESPICPGFINLAGIKSPGLLAAPAIALEGIKLLENCGFKMERKNHSIDERNSYGFPPCRLRYTVGGMPVLLRNTLLK